MAEWGSGGREELEVKTPRAVKAQRTLESRKVSSAEGSGEGAGTEGGGTGMKGKENGGGEASGRGVKRQWTGPGAVQAGMSGRMRREIMTLWADGSAINPVTAREQEDREAVQITVDLFA